MNILAHEIYMKYTKIFSIGIDDGTHAINQDLPP